MENQEIHVNLIVNLNKKKIMLPYILMNQLNPVKKCFIN